MQRIQLLVRPQEQRTQDLTENIELSPDVIESETIHETPPLYTPPPSYSTATGARLARALRKSFRKSVRRQVYRDWVCGLDFVIYEWSVCFSELHSLRRRSRIHSARDFSNVIDHQIQAFWHERLAWQDGTIKPHHNNRTLICVDVIRLFNDLKRLCYYDLIMSIECLCLRAVYTTIYKYNNILTQ